MTCALLAALSGLAVASFTDFALVLEVPLADRNTLEFHALACPPPDSRAECGRHAGEVRLRAWWSPVTRMVFRCRCFFGEPSMRGTLMIFPLDENRSSG